MLSDKGKIAINYTAADGCWVEVAETELDGGKVCVQLTVGEGDEGSYNMWVDFASKGEFHNFINACSRAIRSC